MTEDDLERTYPFIRWREPIRVNTPEAHGLACRYCIALDGLSAEDVANLPQTSSELRAHLAVVHNR